VAAQTAIAVIGMIIGKNSFHVVALIHRGNSKGILCRSEIALEARQLGSMLAHIEKWVLINPPAVDKLPSTGLLCCVKC
jgi:hypothetical protein